MYKLGCALLIKGAFLSISYLWFLLYNPGQWTSEECKALEALLKAMEERFKP